jgi:hypothetical protein
VKIKPKKSVKELIKKSSPSKISNKPDIPAIPVDDFLKDYNLNKTWDLAECIDNLMYRIKNGYFLQWEAVVRDEQGLPLSEKQQEALDDLLSFSEDEDEYDEDVPILYIDERPRPSEPWYETVKKLVPRLILNPFTTYKIYDEIYTERWQSIVECLEEYAKDLSMPEGITSPVEVIPADILHRLWLQYCFDILGGLGQEKELTLANEKQKPWRLKEFIDRLKKHKDSVEFFDLTLEKLFEFVKLPPEDEKILIESMMKELGIKSTSEKLYEVL